MPSSFPLLRAAAATAASAPTCASIPWRSSISACAIAGRRSPCRRSCACALSSRSSGCWRSPSDLRTSQASEKWPGPVPGGRMSSTRTGRILVNKLALAAVLLAAPLAARADTGLRLGGAADIGYNLNDGSGTHFITDHWPVELDAMLSYWTPGAVLSIDLEVAEQWVTKDVPIGRSSRVGTVLRPGIRLSPPLFPLYFRGAIPINVEQPSGSSR